MERCFYSVERVFHIRRGRFRRVTDQTRRRKRKTAQIVRPLSKELTLLLANNLVLLHILLSEMSHIVEKTTHLTGESRSSFYAEHNFRSYGSSPA